MARFNLVLTDYDDKRLRENIPSGIRSLFCRAALDIALSGVEEHGPGFLYLVLERALTLKPSEEDCQILAITKKSEKDEKRNSNRPD